MPFGASPSDEFIMEFFRQDSVEERRARLKISARSFEVKEEDALIIEGLHAKG